MRWTERLQGLRLMKFEEVYGRTHRGALSQGEAAEILGVSERTFRRWRDRYEAEGAEGLYDRRLGRASARRAGVDEVARLLELFDTRYWDFNARHFHEKLVAEHGIQRSYNWVRLTLQAHGRVRAAPRRGAHRRKRPRRALPGMMLHQDGSRHEWTPGRQWDLIVTLDDATSEKRRCLQLPTDRHRHHYVKAKVRVHEYPDHTLAVFHGPRRLARYRSDGQPRHTHTRKAA